MHLNVEIKAHCKNPDKVLAELNKRKAKFIGEDHQVDTYFNVENGRLKLREGNIENALIYYERDNQAGPKNSQVHLYKCGQDSALKDVLTASLKIFKTVDKKRKIFFIGNVKFHLDEVKGLGRFVEIEAIDADGTIGEKVLDEQCRFYLKLFEIKKEDLIENSYADMV
ncbi:MAG: class IV adenylate cyclase [Bacteroidota bacterium]